MKEKPKLSVVITALNLVSGETELRSKTYTKANGLMDLSISGVSNSVPYYGIISRAGTITIIDKDSWLKQQSEDNILPDVSVDIFINDVLQFQFISDNDISYTIQDKKVTIELSDEINQLQNEKLGYNLIYNDTNAFVVFTDIVTLLGVQAQIDDSTKIYMQNISIPQLVVQDDTFWNIIQQFVYGIKAIFYKFGNTYYVKRMKE